MLGLIIFVLKFGTSEKPKLSKRAILNSPPFAVFSNAGAMLAYLTGGVQVVVGVRGAESLPGGQPPTSPQSSTCNKHSR